jgi:hypothetical protein
MMKQSPSCGKQRMVIMMQLVALLDRDLVDVCGGSSGGGGGEDLAPGTPNGSAGAGGVWQGNEEAVGGLGDGILFW